MKRFNNVLTLVLVLSVGTMVPAFSALPEFEVPIQSLEASQFRHVGKFDGDSKPDLLFVYQDKLSYRKGLGNGVFAAPIQSNLDSKIFDTTSSAIGDLTGDQIDDFVFLVPFGKTLQIYKGTT